MRTISWESRLNEYVENCRSREFAWGSWDCGLFVADCLQIILGVDFALSIRGRYDTEKKAYDFLRKHYYVETVEQMFDVVAAQHPSFFRVIPVSAARRGDVVIYDTKAGGPALGICMGAKCCFPRKVGLSFVGLVRCRRAWSVGRPCLK